MPFVKGNRDDVVRTLTGHMIKFEEGEIKWIPDVPALVKACAERGHVKVDPSQEQEKEVAQEQEKLEREVTKVTRVVRKAKEE